MLKSKREIIQAFFQGAVDNKSVIMVQVDQYSEPEEHLGSLYGNGTILKSCEVLENAGNGYICCSLNTENGKCLSQLFSPHNRARISVKNGICYLSIIYDSLPGDDQQRTLYSFEIKDNKTNGLLSNSADFSDFIGYKEIDFNTLEELLSCIQPSDTVSSVITVDYGRQIPGLNNVRRFFGEGCAAIVSRNNNQNGVLEIFLYTVDTSQTLEIIPVRLSDKSSVKVSQLGSRTFIQLTTETLSYTLSVTHRSPT